MVATRKDKLCLRGTFGPIRLPSGVLRHLVGFYAETHGIYQSIYDHETFQEIDLHEPEG